jgi:hypothetical protein
MTVTPRPPDKFGVPGKGFFGQEFVCKKKKMLLATYDQSEATRFDPVNYPSFEK